MNIIRASELTISPAIDHSTQYATVWQDEKPVASIRHKRTFEGGPRWTVTLTTGESFGCNFLVDFADLRIRQRVAKAINERDAMAAAKAATPEAEENAQGQMDYIAAVAGAFIETAIELHGPYPTMIRRKLEVAKGVQEEQAANGHVNVQGVAADAVLSYQLALDALSEAEAHAAFFARDGETGDERTAAIMGRLMTSKANLKAGHYDYLLPCPELSAMENEHSMTCPAPFVIRHGVAVGWDGEYEYYAAESSQARTDKPLNRWAAAAIVRRNLRDSAPAAEPEAGSYRIKNVRNGEYWSNDIGWTHQDVSDVFTAEERAALNLPINGEWVEAVDSEWIPAQGVALPEGITIQGRKVIVSRELVAAFNSRWPGSKLRDSRHYWFEFDSEFDLIDTDVPEQDDGSAAGAMSDDCRSLLESGNVADWMEAIGYPAPAAEPEAVTMEAIQANPGQAFELFPGCFAMAMGGPQDVPAMADMIAGAVGDAAKPVAVIDEEDGPRVVERFETIAQAEEFVDRQDSAKVRRGGFGIDAPEELINGPKAVVTAKAATFVESDDDEPETTPEEMAEYEATARAAGWDYVEARFTGNPTFQHPERGIVMAEDWRDLCESEGIAPAAPAYDDRDLFNCCHAGREPDWQAFSCLSIGAVRDDSDDPEQGTHFVECGFGDAEQFTIYGIDKEGCAEALTDIMDSANVFPIACELMRRSRLPIVLSPRLAE